MDYKIKGVPEGWRATDYRVAKVGDYILSMDKDLKYIVVKIDHEMDIDDYSLSLIIERDIKIIDMSQCKVDMQHRELDGAGNEIWNICESPKILNLSDSDLDDYRVRQNHYFGWEGGECPLPDGLLLKITNHFASGDVLNICSIKAFSHETDFSCPSLTGFKVLGVANGYAYKHEIEGSDNEENT